MRVLDLGGTPTIWEHVSAPREITLLNLPRALSCGISEIIRGPHVRHHAFHVMEGDACNVAQFGGNSYWVQTPLHVVSRRGALRNAFLLVVPQVAADGADEALAETASGMVGRLYGHDPSTVATENDRVVPDGRTRVDYFFGFPKS
jgi:hypothetical protein